MTKQQKIRGIINRKIDRELLRFARLIIDNSDWENLALFSREEIKHILHSQGVVIIDRERKLPRSNWGVKVFGEINHGYKEGMDDMKRRMLEWHNDSLEPLIEEDK